MTHHLKPSLRKNRKKHKKKKISEKKRDSLERRERLEKIKSFISTKDRVQQSQSRPWLGKMKRPTKNKEGREVHFHLYFMMIYVCKKNMIINIYILSYSL